MTKTTQKIMVIDDDPDFIDAVSMTLKSANYDVAPVTNPKEVKQKLLEFGPDLILLDIMMDSLFDGFSLCHEIKTSPEYEGYNNTPIIFVSAVKDLTGSRFDIRSEEEGMKGPDAYLDKPLKTGELLGTIEELLKT